MEDVNVRGNTDYPAMDVRCKYLLVDVVMYDTTDTSDRLSRYRLQLSQDLQSEEGGSTQLMPRSPLIQTMNVDDEDEDDGYE